MSFAARLESGRAGESIIATWLRRRGCSILPVYEKILDDHKGPQLFPDFPHDPIIAPDLLVWQGDRVRWIEAKHKVGFTLHRQSGDLVTGIDAHHFDQYLRVELLSPWPVWLLFLQRGGQTKGGPENTPEGLFGAALRQLSTCVHHRCGADKMGHGGMVFWERESLQQLATLEEMGVCSLAHKKGIAGII